MTRFYEKLCCFYGALHHVESVRILVRIFPGFSRIRTEYGEIRSISPYPVRMRENAGKMRTRITPNTDSFYAVLKNSSTYYLLSTTPLSNSFYRTRNIFFPSTIKEWDELVYEIRKSDSFTVFKSKLLKIHSVV